MSDYVTLDERLRRIVQGAFEEHQNGHLSDPGATGSPALEPYLVDWVELFSTDAIETDWLVEPLLARGRGHALYAGAKTGKSLLCLEVAAALCSGRAVLARAVAERLRVLYLDYEMTMADVRERLEVFGYGPDDAPALEGLHYALLPSIPPLDTAAGGRVIVDAAKALAVDLVVIDTTARAVQGPENDADTYRALYRHTGQLLKEAGITFIRLDHAGQDLDKGQRGSTAKNDDVDVVWQYTRRDADTLRLKATHRRMSWVPTEVDLVQDEDQSTGVMTHRLLEHASMPEGTARIVALLDEMHAPVDISVRAARELLKKAGEHASNAALSKAVKMHKTVDGTRDARVLAQLLGDGNDGTESPARNGQVSIDGTRYGTPRNTSPGVGVPLVPPLKGGTAVHASGYDPENDSLL